MVAMFQGTGEVTPGPDMVLMFQGTFEVTLVPGGSKIHGTDQFSLLPDMAMAAMLKCTDEVTVVHTRIWHGSNVQGRGKITPSLS